MTTSLSASAAVLSAEDEHRLYRRSPSVVVSQVLGGAGLDVRAAGEPNATHKEGLRDCVAD